MMGVRANFTSTRFSSSGYGFRSMTFFQNETEPVKFHGSETTLHNIHDYFIMMSHTSKMKGQLLWFYRDHNVVALLIKAPHCIWRCTFIILSYIPLLQRQLSTSAINCCPKRVTCIPTCTSRTYHVWQSYSVFRNHQRNIKRCLNRRLIPARESSASISSLEEIRALNK